MIQTCSPLVESFLEHQRFRGMKAGSISTFRVALRQFERAIKFEDWLDLSPVDLERYWKETKARLESWSAYAYLRALKLFFRYLTESNQLLVDPTEGLFLPKFQRTLVQPTLTTEEIERLMNSCDVSTPLGLRDRAMLEFEYSTILRVDELRKVKVEDLDMGQALLILRDGKGSKGRVQPIGKVAIQWLEKYLKEARPYLARLDSKVEELFITKRSRPFSYTLARKHLFALGKAVNLPMGLTCHVFRRTVATEMLRSGAPAAAVAKLLGHTDLKSLRRYVKSAAHDLKNAHTNTHPREGEDE